MLLLKPFAARFKKKDAQQTGDIIFFGKPSQSYLFNFLCGVSERNNGVVSMAFETIANHMSQKFNKTMSIQAISQLVKKLVNAGVIEYVTIKLEGNRNSVGTFRIAPITNLLALAAEIKEKIEAKIAEKIQEVKEVSAEMVAKGKEILNNRSNVFQEPKKQKRKAKNIIKSDAAFLPDWAKTGYVCPKKEATYQQRLELMALLGRN